MNTPTPIKFNNFKVQTLYDISHSNYVASLKNTTDIKNALLPLIKYVIDDKEAYAEAKQWDAFNYSVINHIENKNNMYVKMGFEESMCFSLFMYIYH
jgi:hypothetical protein